MAKQTSTGHSAPSDELTPRPMWVEVQVERAKIHSLTLAVNHLVTLHLAMVGEGDFGTAINEGMVSLSELQQMLLRQA